MTVPSDLEQRLRRIEAHMAELATQEDIDNLRQAMIRAFAWTVAFMLAAFALGVAASIYLTR